MAERTFISRFSPNRTDPKTLEAIFVQRHTLLKIWLERLRDSILTDNKSHLLAIGPRGSGKSHLVNLLVHRLQQDPAVNEKVRVAWLPEDEATTSFWKFLLRIHRALNAAYVDQFPPPPRDQIEKADEAQKTQILIDHLLKHLGNHTLLVVVENLDEVMRGLSSKGQKRWRAFLQQHPVTTTLATAQQMPLDISQRDGAFFNFFDVQNLKPLSAQEALELLKKIAQHTKNNDLLAFLDTPTGQARVRAIRHLTGGSHRVFIILSEFATRENLDNLVTAFEELLDELTPYYQERLRWLPDQQREIIEFLCRQNQTVSVKQIASELYLSEQAAAAQLKSLRDKGYVLGESIGREARYGLSEPLMRLCVEVKDPIREPIRLIVEFLRIWYEPSIIEAQIQRSNIDERNHRRYLQAAMEANRLQLPHTVDEEFDREFAITTKKSNRGELIQLLNDMLANAQSASRCLGIAHEYSKLNQDRAHQSALTKANSFIPTTSEQWIWKALALRGMGKMTEAINSLETSAQLDRNNTAALIIKTMCLMELNKPLEAWNCSSEFLDRNPTSSSAWNYRAYIGRRAGKYSQAIKDSMRAIELDPQDPDSQLGLAISLVREGQWIQGMQALNQGLKNIQTGSPNLAVLLLSEFIREVLNSSGSNQILTRRIQDLVDSAARKKVLAHVGKALVTSLKELSPSQDSYPIFSQWAKVWQQAAQAHPDLSLSVRIFTVGVDYLKDKDPRVLLNLLQEERAILQDLFGLKEDGAE